MQLAVDPRTLMKMAIRLTVAFDAGQKDGLFSGVFKAMYAPAGNCV